MKRTLIIAEAGVNHNGDINIAKKLVDAAADAGVDYVKFQTFKADKLVNKDAKQADYQIENTGVVESQYQMLKRLELTDENHHILIDYCDKKGVKFLSTAFDFESIEFLKDKLDFYKIPSGEITNLPYLIKVAKLKLPIVMSTGMANMQEVKEALAVLIAHGINKEDVTILHCNTEYPTPMKDVNLLAMKTIEKELGVEIGYSDHTLGIEIPISAVTLGATVIEKHFTDTKGLKGNDHFHSIDKKDLIKFRKNIDLLNKIDGVSKKREVLKSEKKSRINARRSIVARNNISKGEKFTFNNLIMKRPGFGISPTKIFKVIGKTARKNISEDSIINFKDII